MSAIVESKNATLELLSVTIQALHVNGKQMTLAVFRQLPERIESDSSDLWGVVRYPIRNSFPLWLIFSEGGILMKRNLTHLSRSHFMDEPQDQWTTSDIQRMKSDERARRDSARRNSSLFPELAKSDLARADSLAVEIDKARSRLIDDVIKENARYQYEERLSRLTQLYIAA